MKILIDIGHPAHVHLFKNFASIMIKRGHSVLFTCREKEFEMDLLKASNFNFISFGKKFENLTGKIFGLFYFNFKMLRTSVKFKPDVFISAGSMYAAHVSFLFGKPHFTMEDTGNMEQIRLYLPFTEAVFSPHEIPENLGKNQVRYHSYHELSYLSPKYFQQDKSIYKFLNIGEDQKYAILRFVSWNATHDIGQNGFNSEHKKDIVQYLSNNYTLFISSEAKVPKEFEKYLFRIPPDKIHHAMSFAELVVSEGATMASEAGVLGVPSIYVNSLRRCYNEDQEKYGLVFNFQSGEGVLEKIMEIESINEKKLEFRKRKDRMLKDKIDMTSFLIWYVENYPSSKSTIQKDPDFQYNFKIINGLYNY